MYGVPPAGKPRPAVPPPPPSLVGASATSHGPPVPSVVGGSVAPPPPKKANAPGPAYAPTTQRGKATPTVKSKSGGPVPRNSPSDSLSAANLYLLAHKSKSHDILAKWDTEQFNERVLETLSNEDCTDAGQYSLLCMFLWESTGVHCRDSGCKGV